MTIPTFPTLTGLTWPLSRTRMSKSSAQESVSGKETRIQLWAYPKYKWSLEIDHAFFSTGEYQTLMGFLNSLGGQAQPFYYTDANDNAASAQVFGTGDGTTTTFQLVRAFGGYVEPVQSPIASGLAITVAGTPTTAWTLGNAGLVTFTTAPASGASLAWSGSFNWLCRLASDEHEFAQEMSTYAGVKKLEFQSIKL